MAWPNRCGWAGRSVARRLKARRAWAWDWHGSWPEGVRRNGLRPEPTIAWRHTMMEDGLQGEKTQPGSGLRFPGRFFARLGARPAERAPHFLEGVLHRDACLARCPSQGVGGTARLRVPRPGEAVARRWVCAPAEPMVLVDRACPPQPMRLVWPAAARRRAYPAVRRRAGHRAAVRCVALRSRSAVHAYLAALRRAGDKVVPRRRGRWLHFRAGCGLKEKRAAWVRTRAVRQRRDEAGRRISRRRPCPLGAHP